jgi:hypothetical protein
MTGFAAELRAGGPGRGGRRGLWLTFPSPFGLEVAALGGDGGDGGDGGTEWIGIDVQHGDLDLLFRTETAGKSAVSSCWPRLEWRLPRAGVGRAV